MKKRFIRSSFIVLLSGIGVVFFTALLTASSFLTGKNNNDRMNTH